ncbi:MAG: hypothetical protein HYT72_05285 [Candidatus Aenigmarchaeota archaeon]|nr:hypothetical protein [Candidatus Aenigmarchaeota archaeon]
MRPDEVYAEKHCPGCGSQHLVVDNNFRFCIECGAIVEELLVV